MFRLVGLPLMELKFKQLTVKRNVFPLNVRHPAQISVKKSYNMTAVEDPDDILYLKRIKILSTFSG